MAVDTLTIKTEARDLARRLGIARVAKKVLGRNEDAFNDALRRNVRTGDTVWDVGAHVGVYTERFAEWVGPTGAVVAFEPTEACHSAIVERVAGRENVTALRCGLADADTTLPMSVAGDEMGTTHSFSATEGEVIHLPVRRGESVLADGVPAPDVLKIDVEGFEQEVLQGLGSVLDTSRAVLCEVHFGILSARGLKQAPREIEATLKEHGFTTTWVDGSHLEAVR